MRERIKVQSLDDDSSRQLLGRRKQADKQGGLEKGLIPAFQGGTQVGADPGVREGGGPACRDSLGSKPAATWPGHGVSPLPHPPTPPTPPPTHPPTPPTPPLPNPHSRALRHPKLSEHLQGCHAVITLVRPGRGAQVDHGCKAVAEVSEGGGCVGGWCAGRQAGGRAGARLRPWPRWTLGGRQEGDSSTHTCKDAHAHTHARTPTHAHAPALTVEPWDDGEAVCQRQAVSKQVEGVGKLASNGGQAGLLGEDRRLRVRNEGAAQCGSVLRLCVASHVRA